MTIPSQMRTAKSLPLFLITEFVKFRRVKTRTPNDTRSPTKAFKMAKTDQGCVVSNLIMGSWSHSRKVLWLGYVPSGHWSVKPFGRMKLCSSGRSLQA